MNLFELYAKISLDKSEYESAVREAVKSGDSLYNKFESIARNSETLKNKIKLLAQEYSQAKSDVDRLTESFNKSARENGYASDETKLLAEELKNAEIKASGLASELEDLRNKSNKVGDAFSGVRSKSEGFIQSLTDIKSVSDIAVGVISRIVSTVTQAASAFGNLAEETREFRTAIGKVNTAFKSAGYSVETATNQYTEFYKILGDTDTAAETAQLVAKLTNNEKDLASWTKIAAGVYGTFGDALPINGLIESANETARVGVVTGVLADALNWAGISEDGFNRKLAVVSDTSERNQIIMEALSNTYNNAADVFYENNEQLVRTRENQAELDETMSVLGSTAENLRNKIQGDFNPAIQDMAVAFEKAIEGADDAEEAITDSIDSMVETATEKLPEYFELGGKMVEQVSLALTDPENVDKMVNAGLDMLEQVQDSMRSVAFSIFKGIGNNIVDGIKSGIEDKESGLNRTLRVLANGSADVTMSALGIHSPSKVFSNIGENMMKGIVVGVQKSEDNVFWEMSKMSSRLQKTDFGVRTADVVDFGRTPQGIGSAAIVNAIQSSASSGPDTIGVVNLVLPDGTKFAEYYLPSFIKTANAKGTPITGGQKA